MLNKKRMAMQGIATLEYAEEELTSCVCVHCNKTGVYRVFFDEKHPLEYNEIELFIYSMYILPCWKVEDATGLPLVNNEIVLFTVKLDSVGLPVEQNILVSECAIRTVYVSCKAKDLHTKDVSESILQQVYLRTNLWPQSRTDVSISSGLMIRIDQISTTSSVEAFSVSSTTNVPVSAMALVKTSCLENISLQEIACRSVTEWSVKEDKKIVSRAFVFYSQSSNMVVDPVAFAVNLSTIVSEGSAGMPVTFSSAVTYDLGSEIGTHIVSVDSVVGTSVTVTGYYSSDGIREITYGFAFKNVNTENYDGYMSGISTDAEKTYTETITGLQAGVTYEVNTVIEYKETENSTTTMWGETPLTFETVYVAPVITVDIAEIYEIDHERIGVDCSYSSDYSVDNGFELGLRYSLSEDFSDYTDVYVKWSSYQQDSDYGQIIDLAMQTTYYLKAYVKYSGPEGDVVILSETTRVGTTTLIYDIPVTPSEGEGTVESPFIVREIGHLIWIQSDSSNLAWFYKMGNDIDATITADPLYGKGKGFAPIGTGSYPFTGNFDGDGFSVINLYINRPGVENIGLFGKTAQPTGLVIKNIKLINPVVVGGKWTGSLVGSTSFGTIQNCHCQGGSVTGTSVVGGLIGTCFGDQWTMTVERCSAKTDVSGTGAVGGFTGYVSGKKSYTRFCYSTGNVTGYRLLGGFTGQSNGYIEDCYSRGNVTSTLREAPSDFAIGGFIGHVGSTIYRCYSTGSPVALWNNPQVLGSRGFGGQYTSQTVYTSFFDKDTSLASTSICGATGKTSAELKQRSTYAGWTTFDASWAFTSKNDGYPKFLWDCNSDELIKIAYVSEGLSSTIGNTVKDISTNVSPERLSYRLTTRIDHIGCRSEYECSESVSDREYALTFEALVKNVVSSLNTYNEGCKTSAEFFCESAKNYLEAFSVASSSHSMNMFSGICVTGSAIDSYLLAENMSESEVSVSSAISYYTVRNYLYALLTETISLSNNVPRTGSVGFSSIHACNESTNEPANSVCAGDVFDAFEMIMLDSVIASSLSTVVDKREVRSINQNLSYNVYVELPDDKVSVTVSDSLASHAFLRMNPIAIQPSISSTLKYRQEVVYGALYADAYKDYIQAPKLSTALSPEVFVTQWRIKSQGESVALPIPGHDRNYYFVSWGDGTSSAYKLSDAFPSHTYAAEGLYNVKISGIVNEWSFMDYVGVSGGINNSRRLVRVLNWGNIGLAKCSGGFYGCEFLESIPNWFWNIDDVSCMFSRCRSLSVLPLHLFSLSTETTNFFECFSDCTSLRSLPVGLFANNRKATNFGGCFINCTNIVLNPYIFSYGNEDVFASRDMNFTGCFKNCTEGTGVAPSLWSELYKSVLSSNCYTGSTRFENYGLIPENWI